MLGTESVQTLGLPPLPRLATTENWDSEAFATLVLAARDKSTVSGLTHNFYRYPARFSPKFVRSAIKQFTRPGDLVFDPFMGGGTTLVEAVSLGRTAIGTDISSLATFVSEAKTLIFSDDEFQCLNHWAETVSDAVHIHRPSNTSSDYVEAGYYKHLGSTLTWRLRKAVEQALSSAVALPTARMEAFARCVVLRTGQWALDGRRHLPSVKQFREELRAHAVNMLRGARELRTAVESFSSFEPTAKCFHRSVIGLELQNPCGEKRPKLVLTSPPYPGVHVLYHRWQVDGRKETAAPFWIANKLDGSGAAYYTLGGRATADNWTYFEGLRAALTSVAHICDDETTVVQVVAFSNPERQLPTYLEVVESAGFAEMTTPVLPGNEDGRLWRTIPNRKWYAGQLGDIPASREVVLFHRKIR